MSNSEGSAKAAVGLVLSSLDLATFDFLRVSLSMGPDCTSLTINYARKNIGDAEVCFDFWDEPEYNRLDYIGAAARSIVEEINEGTSCEILMAPGQFMCGAA
jgi:hypothetical protein